MSAHCHHHHHEPGHQPKHTGYRKVLWIALIVNGFMFALETFSGITAHSVSLLADSMDFLGDAANYAISLWVLEKAIATRAKASLFKAISMALFGITVLGNTVWYAHSGSMPHAATMGGIGALALAANLGMAALLYAYRDGDSNMRSVWLCTRNDALGNVAVMLAALGVFGTGTSWPDLIVASIMAGLALSTAVQVIRHARRELAAMDMR